MAYLSFDLLCNILVITHVSVALKFGVISVVFMFILMGSAFVSTSRTRTGMSIHLQAKAQT